MRLGGIREFIQLESFSGILLFFCAIAALLVSNSPLNLPYRNLLDIPIALHFGDVTLKHTLLHWIDDGLMAIFFLLAGLEIKREIFAGELNSAAKIGLPAFGAFGGIVLPALIYLAITRHESGLATGWAIPTATDIAFALGVLSLLGDRIPLSLKAFITAVALFDDLAAILIIAIFYTSQIYGLPLILAAVCLVALYVLNRSRVNISGPYLFVGAILWVCVLKSGVHATLAGVATAMAIPLESNTKRSFSPLNKLEHRLHPWVAYGVLPIFAFANAGVSFKHLSVGYFLHPLPLGIMLGLFIGKQLGIFGCCYLAIKIRLARIPKKTTFKSLYSASLICGIGFTMSLFIGSLAFPGGQSESEVGVRLGVIIGSCASGLLAWLSLKYNTTPSGGST